MTRWLVIAFLLLTCSVQAAPPVAEGPLHVTAQEARKHGLPPLGFRLDTRGSNMLAATFPDPSCYLRMSGPPGGPLVFEVLPASGDLDATLKARFSQAGYSPVETGPASSVKFAGQPRKTRGLVTGQSHARTRWCCIWLEPRGDRPAAVVLLGVAAGSGEADSGTDLVAHRFLAPLVASFELDP
ncbi:MAG: hypothetical protein AB1758_00760 [Candidatus Eremiobacterota bacterium]